MIDWFGVGLLTLWGLIAVYGLVRGLIELTK